MLAVLNKYKIFLILITLILLIVLAWLIIDGQGRNKTPTRGVFVLNQSSFSMLSDGGVNGCSR
jgi:hypothetical protein